jgi:hypothetical protein
MKVQTKCSNYKMFNYIDLNVMLLIDDSCYNSDFIRLLSFIKFIKW